MVWVACLYTAPAQSSTQWENVRNKSGKQERKKDCWKAKKRSFEVLNHKRLCFALSEINLPTLNRWNREEEFQKRVLCLAGWWKKGNKRRQRRRSKADNITNIFFFCSCNIGSFMTTLFFVSHTSPFGWRAYLLFNSNISQLSINVETDNKQRFLSCRTQLFLFFPGHIESIRSKLKVSWKCAIEINCDVKVIKVKAKKKNKFWNNLSREGKKL